MQVLEYFKAANKAQWLRQIKQSDWGAGQYLYELLSADKLRELCGPKTEVLLLTEGEKLLSFCTLAERDDVDAPALTPWVGFVYTFPEYRGRRCFGLLLDYARDLARAEGAKRVYISTNEIGLYEKYGCSLYKIMKDIHGQDTRVYMVKIGD
jgi:GNAT superfamily N-acetyltransferase